MVLIELLIVLAGIIIVVLVVAAILSNPNGPPVTGACRLITRPWRKDYCSGTCGAGQTCVVTGTRPWALGLFGATQARTCACGTPVGPPPPGSVAGIPNPPGPGTADVAPISGGTHPH